MQSPEFEIQFATQCSTYFWKVQVSCQNADESHIQVQPPSNDGFPLSDSLEKKPLNHHLHSDAWEDARGKPVKWLNILWNQHYQTQLDKSHGIGWLKTNKCYREKCPIHHKVWKLSLCLSPFLYKKFNMYFINRTSTLRVCLKQIKELH